VDHGARLLEDARALRSEEELRNRPLAEGELLDPNLASEVELDRLPGVGPATARAVVETRETAGGFRTAEDLLAVRGVGPATLEKLRPYLDLGRGIPLDLARPPPEGVPVPLNRADASELQTLSGIGPALAGRIVAERERRGGFTSLEDLLDVRGIGPATLERIRDRLVLR
jgi:competence protein ComEA